MSYFRFINDDLTPKAPPFTDVQENGLLGVFREANAMKVINLLERVNRNALPSNDDLSSEIG